MTDISLTINGDKFPRYPYDIDFAADKRKVGRPFADLMEYRGVVGRYDSGMLITKSDFVDGRYPIYHFDVENLPSGNSPSTIQLRARLDAGGNYRIHVVVLADKDLKLTSDGSGMKVDS